MADNDELQTNRINGETDDGNALVAKFANFEAAMRTIFKIPADTAMSEAMQIAAGGNVVMTGTLTAKDEPTSDLHVATKSYIDALSVPEFGTTRCRAYLTSNHIASKLPGDLYLPWDAADIDEGASSLWSASNPSRITIPVSGDYLCGFSTSIDCDPYYHHFNLEIQKNRLSNHTRPVVYQSLTVGSRVGHSGIVFLANLAATNYLEFKIVFSSPVTDATIYSADTTFWICRVR